MRITCIPFFMEFGDVVHLIIEPKFNSVVPTIVKPVLN
jgi:hypothetical protein